jgi:hypothetical protein
MASTAAKNNFNDSLPLLRGNEKEYDSDRFGGFIETWRIGKRQFRELNREFERMRRREEGDSDIAEMAFTYTRPAGDIIDKLWGATLKVGYWKSRKEDRDLLPGMDGEVQRLRKRKVREVFRRVRDELDGQGGKKADRETEEFIKITPPSQEDLELITEP